MNGKSRIFIIFSSRVIAFGRSSGPLLLTGGLLVRVQLRSHFASVYPGTWGDKIDTSREDVTDREFYDQRPDRAGASILALGMRDVQAITSIAAPCPAVLASGRSHVTSGASRASARATYMASYAVTFSRNFHARVRKSRCG